MKTSIRAMVIASAMGIPALGALAAPSSAHADYTVCNKTSDAVRVAVGYINARGYVSEGWWTINPNGGCKLLVVDSDTTDPHNYWVYAEKVGGGYVWEGDMDMCTTKKKSPFTVYRAGCADRGFIVHNFVHVEAPAANHTTNLRDGTGIFDEG